MERSNLLVEDFLAMIAGWFVLLQCSGLVSVVFLHSPALFFALAGHTPNDPLGNVPACKTTKYLARAFPTDCPYFKDLHTPLAKHEPSLYMDSLNIAKVWFLSS